MAYCPDDGTYLTGDNDGRAVGVHYCPKCGRNFRFDGNTLVVAIDTAQPAITHTQTKSSSAIKTTEATTNYYYTFRVVLSKDLRAKYTYTPVT